MHAVVHFAVRPKPGQAALRSGPLSGDVGKLPPALAKDLAPVGTASVPACNANQPIGPQHVMSGEPFMVNCIKCKATKEWIDAPDVGARPKDPIKGRVVSHLVEFLGEAAVANEGGVLVPQE